jgi:hypothetical protein
MHVVWCIIVDYDGIYMLAIAQTLIAVPLLLPFFSRRSKVLPFPLSAVPPHLPHVVGRFSAYVVR